MAGCGEMRGAFCDVVCPKPRRIGLSVNDHIRPSRWHIMHQKEIPDSKTGAELLDLILAKGSFSGEISNFQVPSSPPFFCGSPPSRASNPLIQDSHFGRGNESRQFLATPPSPTARKGGSCARISHKPAAVRIEGFDCLSRDRRSISAMA